MIIYTFDILIILFLLISIFFAPDTITCLIINTLLLEKIIKITDNIVILIKENKNSEQNPELTANYCLTFYAHISILFSMIITLYKEKFMKESMTIFFMFCAILLRIFQEVSRIV